MTDDTRIKNELRREFHIIKINRHIDFTKVSAIVVLCAEETNIEGENKQRIDAGIQLLQNMEEKKFLFLGTKFHIAYLKKYIDKKSDITLLFPMHREHESSRTQIISLAKYCIKNHFGHIVIVSHAYHIPRIKRYCVAYLSAQKYDFYPVGDINSQSQRIDNEIEKIIKYAKKGDLPLFI